MNSQIETVLKQILGKTYKDIMSESDIQLRIDFIINSIDISAESFYKTILYNDTDNEVGKLAVDYRIKFISDYETVIKSGKSIEIDSYSNETLNSIINNTLSVINYAFVKSVLNNAPFDYRAAVNEAKSLFPIVSESIPNFVFINGYALEYASVNQIVYSAVFNQNPFNGQPLNSKYSELILNSELKSRCDLMRELQKAHSTGISLNLVRNVDFFG